MQAARDGSTATSANADNFRILFNGQTVGMASAQTENTIKKQELASGEFSEPSLVLSFEEPVDWNGGSVHVFKFLPPVFSKEIFYHVFMSSRACKSGHNTVTDMYKH